MWTHPEYANYLDIHHSNQKWLSQEEWQKLKQHFNIQTINLYLSSSVSEDEREEMIESNDMSKWNPITPDGFFLIDMYFDDDDDVVAIFAREIRTCEVE